MNMVTDFCENTIVSLDQQKTQPKETLKQALHKEEYSEAMDIIDSNEKEVTHVLQQRKSKKFNYLKYHKGRTTQQYEQSSRGRERTKDRPSYAEAANPRYRRVPISSRKSSFINLNDKRHLNPKPSYSNLSIKEKVQNPNWKVPRKTSSKTQFDERKNENYLRHQVADLTKELEKVKSGNSNNHATPIVEQELPSTDSYSKNPFMASYRGQSKKRKCETDTRRHIKLHSRNHGYLKKLRRAVQSTKLLQDDPEGLIINLSSKSFTVYDFKFLNKGLNFCPTPGLYNSREFANDIKHFSRKIKLKAHFGTQTNTSKNENEDFKPETDKTWEPQYTHHTVKTFLEGLERDLDEVQPNTKRVTFHNLSKEERASLKKLQKMG